MWRHRARTNVDDVFRNEQLFGIRRSNVCSQSIFAVSLSSNSTSSSTQLITQFVSHFSWRVSDDATRKIFAKCYLFVVNVFMFSTRFFFLCTFWSISHFSHDAIQRPCIASRVCVELNGSCNEIPHIGYRDDRPRFMLTACRLSIL